MSNLRPPGQPGRYMNSMEHTCGFDGGDDSADPCGQPATHHILAGSPEQGPSDWASHACAQHLGIAQGMAFDWHEIAAVCGIPDSIWQSKGMQGDGFCFWPAEVEAMQQEVDRIETDALRSIFAGPLEFMNGIMTQLTAAGVIPERMPTEPRERALWLKQNRNTGPAKPHNGKRTP